MSLVKKAPRSPHMGTAASGTPTPYETVYGPSKAFGFSAESLRAELDGTGITVTALLPGATDGQFHNNGGMGSSKIGSGPRQDKRLVARQGYEALRPSIRGRSGFVGPFCDDDVMSSTAASFAPEVSPIERLEVLFEELAELTGQRNAIDGRIVEIVAEIDHDGLWGVTGRAVGRRRWWPGRPARHSANADTIATVAHRLEEFPRCAAGHARGPVVAGSGRRHRRARRRRLR